jgi:hexosaminidase
MTARTTRRRRGRAAPWLVLASIVALLAPAWTASTASATVAPAAAANAMAHDIVPEPAVVTPNTAVSYQLNPATVVFTSPGAARSVGDYLAGLLRPSTGFVVPVVSVPTTAATSTTALPGISLLLSGAPAVVGTEGYQLDVTATSVVIRARAAAGLYYGVQTLRQLLPAKLAERTWQSGPWTVPGGHVLDYPRYAHRGAMLDVARHFLPVADVERYIDEISLYKVNYLHLHLTDDQGWRIAINGWPRLLTVGASSGEGGGPGGYYTQAQYKQIVAYAQAHFVTIVPEVDVPAHSDAALASYAQLNCDDVAPPLYAGIGPDPDGTMCVGKALTFQFLNDVIGQIAALTPGPYFDIGGDEVSNLSDADYDTFLQHVQQIVLAHGKKLMGWGEALTATTPADSTGQFWIYDGTEDQVAAASQQGAQIVMSPCIYTYLDQKYAPETPPDPLGLEWAGDISTQTAYSWDPTEVLAGVPDSAIAGVEAPLWTDVITSFAQAQYMTFPRLPAIAEIGWSPQAGLDWTSFSRRLAHQGPLWKAMGVDYYADPAIAWPAGS